MNKKIIAGLLACVLSLNSAHADDDDAWWAIGGFILGAIVSDQAHKDDDKNRQPPPERTPPPRRPPRLIPIYSNVCEYTERYDFRGNRLPPIRRCHREIVGYREVYDYR